MANVFAIQMNITLKETVDVNVNQGLKHQVINAFVQLVPILPQAKHVLNVQLAL